MEGKESIAKDATSKQTVEDLEENEELTEDTEADGTQAIVPSPDGALDQPAEKKEADPI
jgi:hypothetical protein